MAKFDPKTGERLDPEPAAPAAPKTPAAPKASPPESTGPKPAADGGK